MFNPGTFPMYRLIRDSFSCGESMEMSCYINVMPAQAGIYKGLILIVEKLTGFRPTRLCENWQMDLFDVMPAQAGIHISLILLRRIFWTPAFAGVTMTFHTASYAGMTDLWGSSYSGSSFFANFHSPFSLTIVTTTSPCSY